MKCKICGRTFDNYKSLGSHIRQTHKISTESYYNKYLKKSNKEGKCLMCGKKTAFLNMHIGYQPYCCFRCACDSPLKQKHTEDTNVKNRGVKCVFQDENVKHKIKKKIKKLTGYDNISKDPRTIKKSDTTTKIIIIDQKLGKPAKTYLVMK